MKRKKFVASLVLLLMVIFLSLSLISAGWFSDFFDGITGQVTDSSSSGSGGGSIKFENCSQLTPLYRFYNSEIENHFYTISESAKNNLENTDYSYDWIAGYVYPNQVQGTTPLYRFYNSEIENHFYTTSESEKNNLENTDYSYEGIEGYVYPNQVQGTTPLYRFYNSEIENHFYTTSESEKNNLENTDYSYEGIAGHVFEKKSHCVPTEKEEKENITCIDSDGGLNYYEKGKLLNHSISGVVPEDYCLPGTTDQLIERHCLGIPNNPGNFTVQYTCPNGCVDGACVNESEDENESYIIEKDFGDLIFKDASVLRDNCELMELEKGKDEGTCDSYMGSYKLYNESEKTIVLFEKRQNSFDETEVVNRIIENIGEEFEVDYVGGGNKIVYNILLKNGGLYVMWVSDDMIFAISYLDTFASMEETMNDLAGSDFGELVESYVDKYPSTLEEQENIQTCSELISFLETPTNLEIENNDWELLYNSTWESDYDKRKSYYSRWRYNFDRYASDNQEIYADVSVDEMQNSEKVEKRLNWTLEYDLCEQDRIVLENGSEQIVYLCKNLWRLADDSQKILDNYNNYENDINVLWIKDNKLFSIEISENNYYGCNSYEDCQRQEQERHRRQQEDLIEGIEKLINNEEEYVGGFYIGWPEEDFVKYLLERCNSDIEEQEGGYVGDWRCKTEPVICPPHGEQTEVCTRYNSNLGKEEVREETILCNPGMCSGCMVPKRFGIVGDNNCIEYGFRFRQETGDFEWVEETWSETIKGVSENASGSLSVLDTLNQSQYPSIKIYKNNTLDFRYEYWSNETYNFKEGDQLDLMSLESSSSQFVKYLFKIDSIFFDSKNYENSYFNYTFFYETADRVQNYSKSYKVPVYLDMYCDIDGQVKQQKSQPWQSCQNNYECESNVCSYGECVDLKGMAEDANAFKGFFVKVICKLGNLFDLDDYNSCIYEYLGEVPLKNEDSNGSGSSSQ